MKIIQNDFIRKIILNVGSNLRILGNILKTRTKKEIEKCEVTPHVSNRISGEQSININHQLHHMYTKALYIRNILIFMMK